MRRYAAVARWLVFHRIHILPLLTFISTSCVLWHEQQMCVTFLGQMLHPSGPGSICSTSLLMRHLCQWHSLPRKMMCRIIEILNHSIDDESVTDGAFVAVFPMLVSIFGVEGTPAGIAGFMIRQFASTTHKERWAECRLLKITIKIPSLCAVIAFATRTPPSISVFASISQYSALAHEPSPTYV